MGFSFKNIVNSIVAPVVAPVQAAVSLAKGENVDTVVKQYTADQFKASPEYALGTNFTGTGAGGFADGNFSGENVKKAAAAGAAVAGGMALGPTGAMAGYQLGSGNIGGALKSGSSLAGGIDLSGFMPEGTEGWKDPLSEFAKMFGSGSKAPVSGGNSAPSLMEESGSAVSTPVALMILAGGAFLIWKFAKRK